MILRVFRFRSRRISRWATILTVSIAATLVALWFAPAVVGSRFLWPRVVASLTSDLGATLSTRSVTLRWLAPVVVHDIVIAQPEGNRVMTIDAVRTEATLLSLLFGGGDFGIVTIERPEVSLRLHAEGSNVEDLLARYLARSGSSRSSHGRIEIVNAAVEVSDARGVLLGRVDSLQAAITLADNAGSVELKDCRVRTRTRQGSLAARATWRQGTESTDWSIAARTTSLDLALFQPLARRLDAKIDVEGSLALDAEVTWQSDLRRLTIDVKQAEAAALRLAAPQWLGQDQLAFQRCAARGNYVRTGDTWRVADAEIDCDAGHATLCGEFTWPNQPTASLWQQLLATAATAGVQMQGQVDLAQLAASLPGTLCIREGAVIESGTVRFELSGQHQQEHHRWTAQILTSQLAARRDGERFTWSSPFQITLLAQQDAADWRVEKFTCNSSFLTISGDGTPAAGSFALHCDLERLVSELNQFIEFGSLRAAGSMTAQLDWQRNTGQRVTISATSLLENLDLSNGSTIHWHEPRLSVALSMEGERDAEQATRILTGRLQLDCGTDHLDLQLLEPVESPSPDAVWTVGCNVSGQWSSWFPRLQPLLPENLSLADSPSTIQGPLDLQVTAQLCRQGVEIQKGTLRSEPFRFSSSRISIDEQVVAVELKGRWDTGPGRWSVPEATFQSAALAFRLSDFRLDPSDATPRVTGDLAFRADLASLYAHWRIPAKQQDWRVVGSTQGQVSLMQLDHTTRARWSVDIVGAELTHRVPVAKTNNVIPTTNVPAWATLWREPTLKLVGSGEYNTASQTLSLDRFDLTSADKLSLSVQGSLVEPIGACHLDIQGQVTYDLAKLLQQVAPQWNSRLRITGQDTQQFALRGPLFNVPAEHAAIDRPGSLVPIGSDASAPPRGLVPNELFGQAAVRWQSADLLGIAAGPGTVQAKLDAGTVDFGVIEIPLSGGTMRLQLTLRLNAQPPALSVASGSSLSDVQITTSMCENWLKYVAPVAAGATRAQGQFSLSLRQATVPIQQPGETRAQGTLSVQSAHIGPGPLAQQLFLAVDSIKTILQLRLPNTTSLGQNPWVRIPQQNTQFQLADQRVHHDQMMFEIGNVAVYTRGSVGFDQSLALLAQIPIRDEWIAGDRRLEVLRGYSVEIPITGTFDNPRLDRRALERLATDALRKTTGRLLENELNKGLNQLFGPVR